MDLVGLAGLVLLKGPPEALRRSSGGPKGLLGALSCIYGKFPKCRDWQVYFQAKPPGANLCQTKQEVSKRARFPT